MRNSFLFSILLCACYNPNFVSGQTDCSPPPNNLCPAGFTCDTVTHKCVTQGGTGPDMTMPPPPGSDLSTGPDLTTIGPAGYLHTQGGKIVDANGKEVRFTGVTWNGLETQFLAPGGLYMRSMQQIITTVKNLGYNCIRVPFSNQSLEAGRKPAPDDISASPDLAGMTTQQILDKLVTEAGAAGLKIILDREFPAFDDMPALWYSTRYPEQRWIDDWKALAMHYKGNHTVVAFDLHNEPRDPATWGSGNAMTDWRAAAERAGNAILAVNPELLIIVQGVQSSDGKQNYWAGEDLRLAQKLPVTLSPANRVVYAANDFPPGIGDQFWTTVGAYPGNLTGVWDTAFGYLTRDNVAPVMITEFGTSKKGTKDDQWLMKIAGANGYIKNRGMSFAYHRLNYTSDTRLLQMDWQGVDGAIQGMLAPMQAGPIP